MSFQARKGLGESQKWFKKYRVKKSSQLWVTRFLGMAAVNPQNRTTTGLQVQEYGGMGAQILRPKVLEQDL